MIRFFLVRGEAVIGKGRCQPSDLELQGWDDVIAVVAPPGGTFDQFWWDGSNLRIKTPMGASIDGDVVAGDGLDVRTVTGIPAGAQASISDSTGESLVDIPDGSLEITSDAPGDIIRISVSHPRRVTFETEVRVA